MLQYLLRKLFPQSRVLSSIPVTDMILLMQWFADKESRLSQANITSIKSENDNYIIHIKDFNHEYIYTLQVWGNHVRLIRKEEYATIA